ncbi:MAG: phosphoglucosamine mutase [Desulfomonile tiedjei]|uniref:Phosphoglucosamine mutase n=1 Tax=Desulfomonile tiedjei TaxID=2358 RepID=A0A9D6V3A0_9BACT|nr:phosphoglucosamine mutase [Desulfomonile tiedjei]
MKKLFGTDGVRGVANREPMTAETVLALGRALAHICGGKPGSGGKILIGKDTRTSGYVFENALCAGICSMGMNVLLVGPMPTAGIAFLTLNMRCDAGAMISASHNPSEYNGIKFFFRDGFKLSDETEQRMEDIVFSDSVRDVRPTAGSIGKASRINDALGRYVVLAKSTFPKKLSLGGMKIAVDCANGAGYRAAPMIFEELGARVISLGVRPDGHNINLNCGSMNPEHIRAAVWDTGAQIGIALDGDADRVALSDENGEEVSGDQIIGIIARDLLESGTLRKNAVVVTVMSNSGLELTLGELGGSVIRTPVGDQYIVEKLRQERLNFGGEPTGHIVFMDHITSSDGIIAALQVVKIMVETGKTLSQLAARIRMVPQVLRNVEVSRKLKLEEIPDLKEAIRESEFRLKNKGRLVVRYSGTQPVCRVMAEGEDREELRQIVDMISRIISRNLSVDATLLK